MSAPIREATVEVVAAFYDVDPLKVVWHGHYVKYFELARCALLDELRYNYAEMEASGYAWPVTDLRIRYSRPARLKQRLAVTASLLEYEHRLRISYKIRDAATGELLTKAETTQVAVSIAKMEMCFVSPPILFEKLGLKPP